MVQEQVSSIQGLDAFVRGNPEALEEAQRVINAAIACSFSPGAEPGGTEKRRELDRLVLMAADLGEIVVRALYGTKARHTATGAERLS